MSNVPSGAFQTLPTTNGTAYFYYGVEAGQVVMNSMSKVVLVKAAGQAQVLKDVLSNLKNHGENDEGPSLVGLEGLAAVATILGAGIAGLGAGAHLFNYVRNSNNEKGSQSMELQFVNMTTRPLVPWNYGTQDALATSLSGPVNPGATASAQFVCSGNEFDLGYALVKVDTLFGGGLDENLNTLTPTDTNCILMYNGNGLWVPQVNVDGQGVQLPDDKFNLLYAVFFKANTTERADYTVAVQAGIGRQSGTVTFYFLPSCETTSAT